MRDEKIKLIQEINQLWENNKIESIEIAPELLEYLSINDLKNLKAKVLNSLSTLADKEKEWLKQFKKNN